jgi:hypothetical protein
MLEFSGPVALLKLVRVHLVKQVMDFRRDDAISYSAERLRQQVARKSADGLTPRPKERGKYDRDWKVESSKGNGFRFS